MAGAAGFFAGVLPDLDVLIHSSQDPLLFLEYHRQFTHSLLFIPVGALLATLLLWPVLGARLGFGALFVCCLLGYGVHGLLDACTSYGTQLFWPFSDQRVAWSVVAVVDPAFTLPLGLAVLLAAWRGSRAWALAGLGWALLYLLLGLVQRERAEQALQQLADRRGHVSVRLEAKPTLLNLLLWRGMYESEGDLHVAAIRPGLRGVHVLPGGSVPRFQPRLADSGLPEGSRVQRELMRFDGFSQGWIYRDPADPGFVGDARYALLPDAIDALWGVRFDPADPDGPIAFETRRRVDARTRARFFCMLRGRCLSG